MVFLPQGLVRLGERRKLGLDHLELAGEPSEEVANLVWVEAAERYGQVLAAYVMDWSGCAAGPLCSSSRVLRDHRYLYGVV